MQMCSQVSEITKLRVEGNSEKPELTFFLTENRETDFILPLRVVSLMMCDCVQIMCQCPWKDPRLRWLGTFMLRTLIIQKTEYVINSSHTEKQPINYCIIVLQKCFRVRQPSSNNQHHRSVTPIYQLFIRCCPFSWKSAFVAFVRMIPLGI